MGDDKWRYALSHDDAICQVATLDGGAMSAAAPHGG
jgi:hypothetical protein